MMPGMQPWMRSRAARIGMVGALILLSLGAGLFTLSKSRCYQLVGDVACRADTDEKIVALTFDDGPTPEGADAVLATLAQYGVKATFFLIGDRMERWPGQAEKLLAAGHELGNHTYSHERNLLRRQSFYRQEVRKADALLRQAGSDTKLFRPPFGKRLIGLPLEVEAAGYRTIMWDVEDDVEHHPEPVDYAADIVRRVRPGSIILIHPMYRHNTTERAALSLVIEGLQARGYEITTVSDLLER